MTAAIPQPDLATHFALILDMLCRAVAERMARNRATVSVLMLLHIRLKRTITRFSVLLARVAAGSAPPPCRAVQTAGKPRSSRSYRPRGHVWLLRVVPAAAIAGTLLQAMLARPDMVDLLTTAPEAGRILRPLCRMLGVPHINLPPRLRDLLACKPTPIAAATPHTSSDFPPHPPGRASRPDVVVAADVFLDEA